MSLVANVALAVDILARDRASKTLDKVGGSADKASSRLGTLASFGGKALGGLAVAAGGAGIAGALLGVKTAAGMEQARIAFTTMLGSGQKADAFLKQLASFAAKTPFEFPELQTAASSLISAGIQADKVIPIMTTLGNVTSGMGTGSEGVKRATIALQQMSAAGRITGEDLNQLRDAGIPVYDLLAKATGKSKAEVVKLAQAGKLGSKELGQMMKALETGAGLERFSGLMDKQSQSLTGLWSTFQDTLGMGLAKLITPAIPALKRGLSTISSALGNMINGITGNFAAVTGPRSPFFVLGNGVRALVQAFRDGDVTSNGFVGKMETVGVALRGVVGAGRDFVGAIMDAGRAVSPMLEDALVSVGKALVSTIKFFNDHRGAAKALAATIVVLVLATKAHAAALAVDAAGGMAAWIKSTKIVTVLTKTWAAVQWLLNAALSANPIALVVIGIAALTAGLIIAYKKSDTFRAIVQGAMHGVAAAIDFVRDHWKVFATAFALLIGGPILGAIVLLVTHFGTVKRIALDVFTGVGKAATGMWSNVLRPTFAFIANAWFTVVGALVNGAAKAFGWVPGLGGKLKGAAKAFNAFRDEVKAALDGTVKDSYTKGQQIAAGLAKGITSQAKAVQATAYKLAAQTAYAIARGADVASPSKITTYVGKMLAEGLRVGITTHGATAVAAAKKLMGLVAAVAARVVAPLDRAIAASRDRLSALKDSANQLKATARDNARSFASILGFQPEEGKPATAGDVLKSMAERLAKVKAFRANMAKLAKMGLNKTTYRDLLEGGVDSGGSIASALLTGGSGAVRQTNALQGQINTASNGIGQSGANVLYGDQIHSEQDLLAKLMATRAAWNRQTININVHAGVGDPTAIAKQIQALMLRLKRASGVNLGLA